MTRQSQLNHSSNPAEPLVFSRSPLRSWRGLLTVALGALVLLAGIGLAKTQGVELSPTPQLGKKEKPSDSLPSGAPSPSAAPALAAAQPPAAGTTRFGLMAAAASHQAASEQSPSPSPTQQPPQPSSPSSRGTAPIGGQTQPSPSAAQEPAAPIQPAPPSTGAEQSNPPAGTPKTPPQSEAKAEGSAESAVALNLENADLYQVLRIIGAELKINYVVDPAVKGSVTINTSGYVSRESLFSVLESILQVNGAAMVKANGYYRVVPMADAKTSPLPLELAKVAEVPPNPGETMVLQVVPMHFVSALEMSKILSPFISPAGVLVINDRGNFLLIAETAAKLKQVMEIINVFDNPTFSRQRVRLYPIVNNTAKTLINDLQNIFAGYALSGTTAIRFVPIDSLNAVLAISPSPDVFPDIEQWINRLDKPSREAEAGIQNFVYLVQNAKASDLRDILIELYGGEIPKQQLATVSQATMAANPMVPREALEEQQKAQLPQPGERVQGRIRIMSDDKNNALIVQAAAHDYEIVKRTITQLDLLPRQVLIDAKIYEVDLTGDLSFGISAYLKQNSSFTTPPATLGQFVAGATGGSLQAQTFAIIGATRTLQLFLNASDNRSRVRMLSAPSILVTDNTSARVQVGSQVPVPIGSSLTPVQSGGSSVFAQTIQMVDTGVILTVTPHINASGIVLLNITQEVSSAVPNTTSAVVAPVIKKNAFQTSVVLSDGEPLALGGIIITSDSVTTDRIPILGAIPKLGALFGQTTKNTTRTELVLLLTPHVLQDLPHAAANTQDFLERMRETKKAMEGTN